MPDTTDDLPDRLEAALTERFTELGNTFSAMRRPEKGPDGWPASHPVGPHQVAEVLRELLAAAPAVPSEPADRPAILREAADAVAKLREKTDINVAEYQRYDFRQRVALGDAEGLLRRLAVEAPAPSRAGGETQQGEAQAAGWHLTPQTLDLFVRALVNEVDYDIHKGYECGEEDGEDHYPELVADAAEMLDVITAAQPAAVPQPGREG